ncbi:MAG: peptidoglycan recognition family protein [Phycisphaerales bacterium JB054]
MAKATGTSRNARNRQMGFRAKVVWASLVGSMTAVTALLMALDHGSPTRLDGLALPAMVATQPSASIEAVFRTRVPAADGQWLAIVIDHTGAPFGTPASINAEHKAMGLKGLGYDFVIGNGQGMGDGEIHVGERWLEQSPGAHTAGPDGDWYNRHAIGIALVGDGTRRGFSQTQMTRLLDLVSALAREYQIPPERIVLHSDVAPVAGPGRYFPAASLREQIDSWR